LRDRELPGVALLAEERGRRVVFAPGLLPPAESRQEAGSPTPREGEDVRATQPLLQPSFSAQDGRALLEDAQGAEREVRGPVDLLGLGQMGEGGLAVVRLPGEEALLFQDASPRERRLGLLRGLAHLAIG